MAEYLHRGHTVTDLKYHFVWATKYRFPVLEREVAVRARDLIREVCEAREITVVKGVVSRDHVHVMVSAPPQLAPAQIMRWVKVALVTRKRWSGCTASSPTVLWVLTTE